MMNKEDSRLLILAAFRYSLGRRTYMPSFIVEQIIKNHKIFNKHNWKQFIEEINETDDLGDDCDIQTWRKLEKFCRERIENGN